MKTYAFPVVIEEDQFEDGRKAYHAYCKYLKGCRTWGHTYEEALVNIREVIELCVTDMKETGQTIPVDPALGVIELVSPSVVVNV